MVTAVALTRAGVKIGCLATGLCKTAIGCAGVMRVGTWASTEPCVPTVRWLGPGTHQEEAPGGPLLGADILDRGHAQKDVTDRTKHVCSH